ILEITENIGVLAVRGNIPSPPGPGSTRASFSLATNPVSLARWLVPGQLAWQHPQASRTLQAEPFPATRPPAWQSPASRMPTLRERRSENYPPALDATKRRPRNMRWPFGDPRLSNQANAPRSVDR